MGPCPHCGSDAHQRRNVRNLGAADTRPSLTIGSTVLIDIANPARTRIIGLLMSDAHDSAICKTCGGAHNTKKCDFVKTRENLFAMGTQNDEAEQTMHQLETEEHLLLHPEEYVNKCTDRKAGNDNESDQTQEKTYP